jgi:hypothetical protein
MLARRRMDDGGPNPAEVAETPLELRAALRLQVRDTDIQASRHDQNGYESLLVYVLILMYQLDSKLTHTIRV